MSKLKELDVDEALDKAMEVFWCGGYENTSIDELIKAMDIDEKTLYRTFGDRHSLFIDSLNRYTDSAYAFCKNVFDEADTPYEGMKKFLTESLVDFAAGEFDRKGCFSTNTLIELGIDDDEVNVILDNQTKRIERMLCKVISEGQKDGVFRRDLETGMLATMVNVMILGIMADCKAGKSKDRTKQIAYTFFKTLTP